MNATRTLAVLTLVLLPSIALAANATTAGNATTAVNSATDRKITVEDPGVAAALRKSVGTPAISEEVAREFGPLLYLDKKLTPNESDLILELAGTTTGKITITDPRAQTFEVPVLSAGARDFLSLFDPPELNSLWLKGPVEMKKFVDVTILNPHIQPEVVNFFGMNLYVSWRASVSMDNNRYIRETLKAAVSQFRLSGPETERRGKALLYLAMKDVDAAVSNAIPNEIYLDLRPTQPATN